MRTVRPSRSQSPFRRTPLFAAVAAAVTAHQAFAACTPNLTPPNLVFCVTNTSNSGPGSLSQAFTDASNGATCAGTTPTIGFAIPGTGPFTIAPSSTLNLFCGSGSVNALIDGTSQAGYTPNTSGPGFNSAIQIVVSGTASFSSVGAQVQDFGYGASMTIKGMEFRNFTYGGFATALSGPINLLGSRVVANTNGMTPNNGAVVGGTTLADRNVFANASTNISVAYGGSVTVRGNLIGTNDTGNASAGASATSGIKINGGSANIFFNVIAGISGNGIELNGASSVVISGNKIGMGSNGSSVPNSGHGIYSTFSNGNSIVTNTIAFNGGDGVNLTSGGSTEIRWNSIHSNGGKAINLGAAGQLPNDANDADTGANGLQNYPVISSIVKDGTNTTINWSLNTAQIYNYGIDFYSNPSATAVPQSQIWLDPSTLGFTPASGNTSVSPTITGSTVIPGSHEFITATATNTSLGETSELSAMALGVGGVLTPTAINFGNIVVNASSSPQNATINSIGASPYVINLMSGTNTCYGGPPAPAPICSSGGFICSTTCATGQPYTGGSSCSISAQFAPTSVGAQSTTVYICDNAGGNPRTLTLSGNGIAPPPPTVSPPSNAFGNVEVNGSSAAQTFTVTNPSPASITLSSFTVTGPFSILANNCGASLNPSASCSLDARFNPVTTGSATGAISATASSGSISIGLSGTGTANPAPTMTPPAINFGSVQVGASSTPGTFTITNGANSPVTLSGFSTTLPFSIVATTCGASLPSGSSCTADVKFSPTAVGPSNATVNNVTGFGAISAGVTGTGTSSPPPTIAPLTHDFGPVFLGTASAPQTFTFTNPGLVPATLGAITATPPFSLVSTNCVNPMPASSSCTADVKFVAGSIGIATGTLSANISGGTLSASLSGTGAPAPVLTITPPSFDFGTVLLGQSSSPTTFVVKNPGPTTQSLDSLAVTGPFQLVSTTCASSLASLATCNANVRFTPTQPNIALGSLKAATSFGTSSANLQGNGLRQPAVELATEPVEFGSLTVGTPPVQRTLRLTNTGNDILGINSITIARPFTLANACGVSLAPGDSCTFTVGFDPTEIGDFTQNLGVSTNAPNASFLSIRVHAQVQARPEPLVRVSPRIIGFGDRMGGTQSPAQRITLTNEGGVAANLNLTMTSANFVVINTSCGATLAPQRSCDTDVAFQPQGFGPKRGQYVVSSNSPDSPLRVDLSGAGCRPVQVTQGRGTPPNNCAP